MAKPTTAQALMKAEQLEVNGCISAVAMSLVQLKNDIRLMLGNDAYEELIANESNNVSTFISKE